MQMTVAGLCGGEITDLASDEIGGACLTGQLKLKESKGALFMVNRSVGAVLIFSVYGFHGQIQLDNAFL